MELGLCLGDTPKAFPLNIVDKSTRKIIGTELGGFCMGVGKVTCGDHHGDDEINDRIRLCEDHGRRRSSSSDRPVQLDLLPVHHHHHHPIANNLPFPAWLTQNLLVAESGRKSLEVKRRVLDEGAASPNSCSTTTTTTTTTNINHDHDHDEDENGGGIIISRKKLRLTKQQSAFLEHSFKQHHTTLNPKQKLALANQLNLRPRQVEVWFQNRRARTKLKQTEVDCEYLRQCCETLTQDNKRLKKELQQLRALNNNQLYTHLRPATTLTMCPSCERVVASGGGAGAAVGATAGVLSLSSTTTATQAQQAHPAS